MAEGAPDGRVASLEDVCDNADEIARALDANARIGPVVREGAGGTLAPGGGRCKPRMVVLGFSTFASGVEMRSKLIELCDSAREVQRLLDALDTSSSRDAASEVPVLEEDPVRSWILKDFFMIRSAGTCGNAVEGVASLGLGDECTTSRSEAKGATAISVTIYISQLWRISR